MNNSLRATQRRKGAKAQSLLRLASWRLGVLALSLAALSASAQMVLSSGSLANGATVAATGGGSNPYTFYPTNTATQPALWYWGTAITGKTTGDKVTNWVDLSANSYTLTNGGNNLQPVWTNSTSVFSNKAFLLFDGSNDRLKHGGGNWAQPSTTFLVLYYTSGAGDFFNGTNASTRHQINFSSGIRVRAGISLSGPNTFAVDTPYILEVTWNGASTVVATNGVTYKTGDAGSQPLTGCIVGADESETFFAKFGVAEIVHYNANLSAADRANLRTNYFGPQYSITTQ